MAEKDGSREDPVLVRPYVKAVAEAERAPDEQPETWPEAAVLPVEPDDTLVQPAVRDEPPVSAKPRFGLHPLARAGIFVGGAALALGVVGYLILGPASDPGLPQPGVALPAAPGQAPLDPSIGSVGPSGKASPSTSASPSASPSASAVSPSASLRSLVPSSAPAGSAPPSAAPADPTLTPPASARTGKITAASGRCLARGGIFGGDGSPVQVAGCLDVSVQTFTLATDGTLRVGDRCAAPSSDGTVRTGACGDGDAGQWRAGPDGTLINSSGGGCLTDPGRAGSTTTVTGCSGAATQSWTLP